MKRNEKGQVLVLVALAILVLLGFAALGIDAGYMYSVRHELQRCADAGALAGASAFRDRGTDSTDSTTRTLADSRAMDYATRDEVSTPKGKLTPSEVSVSFPTTPNLMRIRVDVQRTVPLFFARVLGWDNVAIPAFAVAEAFPVSHDVACIAPWGIPVPWVDSNHDNAYTDGEKVHWDENGHTGAPTQDECAKLASPTVWDASNHQIVGTQSERDQYLCQGSLQVLKIGDPSTKLVPGNFFGMDLSDLTESCPEGAPSINSGAAFYYYMIENSCACKMKQVGIDNNLPVDTKPGNMVQNTITAVAPTSYYVDTDGKGKSGPLESYLPEAWGRDPAVPGSLMNRDPGAEWTTGDPFDKIPGGAPLGGFTPWSDSPRIVRIPIYHPNPNYKDGVSTPTEGKSSFKPLGFVGFWIQDIKYDPPNNGTIYGRFVTVGGWGKGDESGESGGTPVLNIRLVE